MISSRTIGRALILWVLTLGVGGCRGSSDGGSAASVDAGAAENMLLDAATFRSLAEHPYRYHPLTQTKTEGADARTTRAQQTGAATDITIVSPDFVTLDQGSDETALAEWLTAHPQDVGHG